MKNIEINSDFQDKLDKWLIACRAMIVDYYAKNYPNLTPTSLIYEEGKRYLRIVSTDGNGASRSAWAFVDKTNGDILKPSSWKIPAKHARSNLNNIGDETKGMGPYGPPYLK